MGPYLYIWCATVVQQINTNEMKHWGNLLFPCNRLRHGAELKVHIPIFCRGKYCTLTCLALDRDLNNLWFMQKLNLCIYLLITRNVQSATVYNFPIKCFYFEIFCQIVNLVLYSNLMVRFQEKNVLKIFLSQFSYYIWMDFRSLNEKHLDWWFRWWLSRCESPLWPCCPDQCVDHGGRHSL